MGEQTKHLQKLVYMVLNSKQNIMHHILPLECCDVSHIGVCEARTPNAKTRQLPSTGTVTPPEKAQLRIRTNSINGTRNCPMDNLAQLFYLALTSRPCLRHVYVSMYVGANMFPSFIMYFGVYSFES